MFESKSSTATPFVAPHRVVATEEPVPEWLRLPAPRRRCTLTNLSRTTLCELCVPCEANDFKPPVRSIVIRKKNAVRGIRLINRASLLTYFESLEKEVH